MVQTFYRLFACVVFIFSVFSLNAAVLKVDDTGYPTPMSGGTVTLSQAMVAAVPGDTILINVKGTMIVFGPDLIFDKPLTIIGPSASHFTIDANSWQIKFDFAGGNLHIEGIRFINSPCPCGSFLSVQQSANVTFKDCVFEGLSTSGNGAAILALNTSVVNIENCSFFSNTANGDGGAVYVNAGATANVRNSTFFNNTASSGGAIYSDGTLLMVNNTFLNNTSTLNLGHAVMDGNTAAGTKVRLQNNIFTDVNNTKWPALLNGSLADVWTNDGGNVYSQNGPLSFVATGLNDVFGMSNSLIGLRSSPVTNGYGLKYFPIILQTSPAVDNGTGGTNVSFSDCRRAPRAIYGDNALAIDAGAVEYTPFTVTSNNSAGFFTTWGNLNASSFAGPKYMDFDISGGGPITYSISNVLGNSTSAGFDWMVDGFTQNGSVVPGPGVTPNTFTPGNFMVRIVNGTTHVIDLVNPGINSFISGLNLENDNGNSAIQVSGGNIHIYGNQLFGTTPNGANSIALYGANIALIGGDMHYNRNVIGRQFNSGVLVQNDVADIRGNFIGTNSTATGAVSTDKGIYMAGNILRVNGKVGFPSMNIISGNLTSEIEISAGTFEIKGNLIGPNATESGIIGTCQYGINAGFNTQGIIGGTKLDEMNIIGGHSIGIMLNAANDVRMVNNFIGLSHNPPFNNLANSTGINIYTNGDATHSVGDGTLLGKNFICYNTVKGIAIEDGSNHIVDFNFIGVRPDNVAAGNGDRGIHIFGISSSNNSINNNIISNHSVAGIDINGTNGGMLISGNKIGTDPTGFFAQSNGRGIQGVSNTNTTDIFNNIISGNTNEGLYLDNTPFDIFNNVIGLAVDSSSFLGNGSDGLLVYNTSGSNISNNIISGNGNNGIIFGNGSSNTIRSNLIGTDIFNSNRGNTLHGIALFFAGTTNNTIGGTAVADRNIIAYNGGAGIDVEREVTTTNIHGNSFQFNSIKGILLGTQTVPTTPLLNDVNDADVSGPALANVGNDGQNYPVLNSCVYCSGSASVNMTLNVDNVTADYRIQVYKVNLANIDGTGHGEGDTLIVEQTVNAGGNNTFSFDVVIPGANLNDIYSVTASKLFAGAYSTSEFSDTIIVRGMPNPTLTVSSPILCNGGFASLTVTHGGTAPFNYDWIEVGVGSTGVTTVVASLPAGTYVCSVTDANCTVLSDTITLTEPPLLTVTASPTNPLCNASCDGSILLTETGGTPPYQYSIDNGSILQPTNIFTSQCAGVYQFLVQDANGCTTPTTGNNVNLIDPPALFMTPTFTNETCSGLNDGSITVTPFGGTGPYNYQIDGGGFNTATTFNGLTPGNHIVDILDANGCTSNILVNILQGDVVVANFTNSGPTICQSQPDFNFTDVSSTSNGTITSWQWTLPSGSPSSSTTQNISNVYLFNAGANSVTLQVTSSNGCVDDTVMIVNTVPSVFVDAGLDTTICLNQPFTQVGTVTGGTPGYSYSWNPASDYSNPLIEDPTVNTSVTSTTGTHTYIFIVTDANGCTDRDTMILSINNLPTVFAPNDFSACTGSLITLAGSGSAVSYSWDNSVIDGTPFNAPASTTTYTVTGIDAAGCTATDLVTVTSLVSPVANAGLDATTCVGQPYTLDGNASTGSITTYQWDEVGGATISNAITTNVNPSVNTQYALTVSNGTCSDSDSMMITVGPPPDASFNYSTTAYCQNDGIQLPSNIVTAGGVFSSPDAPGSINATTGAFDMTSLAPGVYKIYYTLSSPCLSVDSVLLNVFGLPDATVNNGLAQGCVNSPAFDLNSLFTPITTGGTWSGPGVTDPNFDPSVSGAGNFIVTYTVTDGNGCTNADTASIEVSSPPAVSFTGVSNAYCNTDAPFLPTGTPAGGLWSVNGSAFSAITSIDPASLPTGTAIPVNYQYTDPVTGCVATAIPSSFTVYPMPLAPVSSSPTSQTVCAGSTVSLTASNPNTGNGTLTWFSDLGLTNQLGFGPSFTTPPLTANTTVYLSVVNPGCFSSILTFDIIVNNASVSAGPDLTICPGTTAQLNVTSATGTISWSPGISLSDSTITNPIATPNLNTTYVVTVTSGPCSASDSVNVFIDGSNPDCGIVPSYNAFSPDLDGVNDVWVIDAVINHPDNVVTIFNRWGDKLVTFEDYNNTTVVWDGTYNGNFLPSGTYFYVVEYLDISMQVSGWVQLTR